MKLKNIIAVALSVILIIAIAAGCSSNEEKNSMQQESEQSEEVSSLEENKAENTEFEESREESQASEAAGEESELPQQAQTETSTAGAVKKEQPKTPTVEESIDQIITSQPPKVNTPTADPSSPSAPKSGQDLINQMFGTDPNPIVPNYEFNLDNLHPSPGTTEDHSGNENGLTIDDFTWK